MDSSVLLTPGTSQLPHLGPGAAPRHRVTLRELLQPQQPGPSCLQLGRHGRRELLGCYQVEGRQPGVVGEALSEQGHEAYAEPPPFDEGRRRDDRPVPAYQDDDLAVLVAGRRGRSRTQGGQGGTGL